MSKFLFCFVCLVLGGLVASPLRAVAPPFSYLTLTGTNQIAVSVEDIDRDFAVFGLNAATIAERVTAALSTNGIVVVPYADALTDPQTALLRVRIISNHDAHGFYHLSVKLELRRKISLGDSGGFVSQSVWTDARNGVVQASEVDKIQALIDELIAVFSIEHRAQNAHPAP